MVLWPDLAFFSQTDYFYLGSIKSRKIVDIFLDLTGLRETISGPRDKCESGQNKKSDDRKNARVCWNIPNE